MKFTGLVLRAIIAFLFGSAIAVAGVPSKMSYQGFLSSFESTSPINGVFNMRFTIYSDSASFDPINALWQEEHTDSHGNQVSVQNGLFHVLLGVLNPIPASVFETTNTWIGIKIGSDPEISPRTRLATVAYAYRASKSDSALAVAENSVSSIAIADGTVMASDLSDNGALAGQVLKWSGTAWEPRRDSVDFDYWTLTISDGADTSLVVDKTWGLARSGSLMLGTGDSTHVNIGTRCTTGVAGEYVPWCTVSGGRDNSAHGWGATVGGGWQNNAEGHRATISGGRDNFAGPSASVAGGETNSASTYYAAIGGGRENSATNFSSFVGGGENNFSSGYSSAVTGGYDNHADGVGAFVGGGWQNRAISDRSAIGGGRFNRALGMLSFVGGGESDSAVGAYSSVPGGKANKASGDYSMASGRRAKADHTGVFVWSDSLDEDFGSTAPNQFLVRASGGVGIGTSTPSGALDVAGGVVNLVDQSAVSAGDINSFSVSSSGIYEKVPYSSEQFDRQQEYDSVSEFRFVASSSGDYLVCAALRAPFPLYWEIDLFKNGLLSRNIAFADNPSEVLNGSCVVHLDAEEYVEIFVYLAPPSSPASFVPNSTWNWLTINKLN